MIPTKQQVVEYAATHGVTCQSAALTLLQKCTSQEMVYELAAKLAKSANSEARKLVTDHRPELSPEKLTLFELHSSLPGLVRLETEDGDEMFTHWQNANLDQHAESLRWKGNFHLQQAGICERQQKRIYDLDVARDVSLGYLIFSDVTCAICGNPWVENDPFGPFEQAHTEPVAGRSGNTDIEWAHRKCNESEGTA